jgi:hypothetical protein
MYTKVKVRNFSLTPKRTGHRSRGQQLEVIYTWTFWGGENLTHVYKRERHPDHPVSSSSSQAWHIINSSIWMGKLSILPGDELASGEIESTLLVPRWVGDHACTRTPTTPELGAGLVLMNADEYIWRFRCITIQTPAHTQRYVQVFQVHVF